MAARLGALLLVALVFATPAAARTGSAPVTAKLPPKDLRAFLLRVDEPEAHSFSRTPSFSWSPVPAAARYEFELSTSRRFTDNGIIYSNKALKSPVASIPIALPWITGAPYSLYAHVRAVTTTGTTAWSAPYGFNMRWTTVPAPEPSYPGLLRWSPVAGASGYQVWLPDVRTQRAPTGKVFSTVTNVADERELYTFHQSQSWTGSVRWRVRAVRRLYGAAENAIPPVSYSRWSPIYTSYNPPIASGPLSVNASASDVVSSASAPTAHALMPAFLFSGTQSLTGQAEELYRVYVFTDEDCVNTVFRGAVVGSPAYAPRASGTLALPGDEDNVTGAREIYLDDGAEPPSYTADGTRITATETTPQVDLWDNDWPVGRYYWTVVPVHAGRGQPVATRLVTAAPAGSTSLKVGGASGFAAGDALDLGEPPTQEKVVVSAVASNTITLGTATRFFHAAGEVVTKPAAFEYRDVELAQDACDARRVLTFGKSAEPTVGGAAAPYASGLSPRGHLVSASVAKPSFYGVPLIAWKPALGADEYEVQLSRKRYPYSWQPAGTPTPATSLTLPQLTPGTWYYRVRGINYSIQGPKPQMSWSNVVKLVVTNPRFRVVKR